MKKLFIIFSLIIVSFVVNAQKVYTIAADTVQGAETIYFTLPELTGNYEVVTLQALCTNVGGTSDGSIVIEGSIDGTSYKALENTTNIFHGMGNDTLTITDGAVGLWVIEKNPFTKYRFKVAGTASDTTLITPKWYRK